MIPSNRLLLSSWFEARAKESPLKIFDVGAREEMFKPYNHFPAGIMKIYGFEPDREEAIRLSKKYPKEQREYFPYGLWKTSGKINLSYAKQAGNSSIHPPDMDRLKAVFPKKHWEKREPKEQMEVDVRSIDDLNKELSLDCDLLKVDTQGSEMEILKGAEKLLKDSVSFVLLETWTFEVHKGQALSGEIMEWMDKQGFTLLRINQGADWHRKEIEKLETPGLRSLVGLDLLFVRNSFDFGSKAKNIDKAVIGAGLAELYGFPDLGMQILAQVKSHSGEDESLQKAESLMIKNWKHKPEGFFFKAFRKLSYMAGYHVEKVEASPYAPLH